MRRRGIAGVNLTSLRLQVAGMERAQGRVEWGGAEED